MRTTTLSLCLLAMLVFAACSGSKMSDSAARSKITGVGITVKSSGNCNNRNVQHHHHQHQPTLVSLAADIPSDCLVQNSKCTSLDQVNSGTVDGIMTLKKASGCSIIITGGTETGHASGMCAQPQRINQQACIG
jgi:hypothetical protein